MHKECIFFCQSKHLRINLIAGKCFCTSLFLIFLTHTCPCISIYNISIFHNGFWIICQNQLTIVFICDALRISNNFFIWFIAIWGSNANIQTAL